MLIGITGKKTAGKDTLATGFKSQGFMDLKMGDPLKQMLRALYVCAGVDQEMIERKIEGDLKEVSCEYLGGQSPRHAMVTLGTAWRDMITPDLWINIWRPKAQLMLAAGLNVICTDVRRLSEAQAIRDLGGVMVRVDRPGLISDSSHITETEMDSIPVDAVFNNDRSQAHLALKAINFLKEHQL